MQSTLLQQTLPELEFRGRSRQIGKTPLYISYLTSFTSIDQSGPSIEANYLRADLFPTLSVPISTLPWLDASVSLSYRLTHYTQRNATPGEIVTLPDSIGAKVTLDVEEILRAGQQKPR